VADQAELFTVEPDNRIERLRNWICFQWAFVHIFWPTEREVVQMAQETRLLCETVIEECDAEFKRHCKLINAFDAQRKRSEMPPPFPAAPHPINENEVRNRVGRVIYDIFGPQHVHRRNPSKLARQCAELQERLTTLITNMPPIAKDQPQ
jgi:hypothetical protein